MRAASDSNALSELRMPPHDEIGFVQTANPHLERDLGTATRRGVAEAPGSQTEEAEPPRGTSQSVSDLVGILSTHVESSSGGGTAPVLCGRAVACSLRLGLGVRSAAFPSSRGSRLFRRLPQPISGEVSERHARSARSDFDLPDSHRTAFEVLDFFDEFRPGELPGLAEILESFRGLADFDLGLS